MAAPPPQDGRGSARTIAPLTATGVLLVLLSLVIETRVATPLLPLRFFRLQTLATANVVGLLLGGSFFAFIFIGTLYMQQVLGFDALQAGLSWLAASITSVALAGLAQALVTRVSVKLVMAFGMALIGGGIVWAAQAPVDGRFWFHLAGPFFVVGAGTAFAFIPVSIAGLAGVAHRDAGVASGLLNATQQIGGSIGVAIASTVAASRFNTLAQSGASGPAALTGGFQWALWVCGAIGLIAVPLPSCSFAAAPSTVQKPLRCPRRKPHERSQPTAAYQPVRRGDPGRRSPFSGTVRGVECPDAVQAGSGAERRRGTSTSQARRGREKLHG